MGCVSSKGDINDLHPNIFQVMNVDDSMQPRGPGQIEITELELVLHQRGKSATRWPLRSLRKYGFDSEIFSFECGRRCATGPGIYAFRCRKAEVLFNLLQHNIQVRNLSDENEGAVVRRPEGYLNPNTGRPTLSRPGSITSNGPVSPVSISTPPLEHNNNKRASLEHSYLNTNVIDETVPYINIASESAPTDTSHLYMNVNTETIVKDLEDEPSHNYANVDTSDENALSLPTTPTSLYVTIREVNYVELDLVPGKTQQAPPPDSPNKTKSYVTIDFKKTNALQQSVNPQIDHEEGSRKTRHNSTIGDVNTRHSNSISD